MFEGKLALKKKKKGKKRLEFLISLSSLSCYFVQENVISTPLAHKKLNYNVDFLFHNLKKKG